MLVCFFFLFFVGGYAASIYAIWLLKSKHNTVWRDVGSPHPVFGTNLRNLLPLLRFVWSGAYNRLSDRRLSQAFLAGKILIVLALVVWIYAVFGTTGG